MRLFSRLFFFLFIFNFLYSESNFSFSVTNDKSEGNYQFHTPSIQYERKDVSDFSSISSKINSAFVHSRSYGSIGQVNTVSIDGGLSSHTKIGWDGINIEFPQMSSVDVSLLPIEFANEVEIYRDNLTPLGLQGQGGYLNFLPVIAEKNGFIDVFLHSFNTYGGKFLLHTLNEDFKGDLGFSFISSSNNFQYVDKYDLTNFAHNLDYIRYSLFSKFNFPFLYLSFAHTYREGGTGISYNLSPRQKDIFTVSGIGSTIYNIDLKVNFINWENIYLIPDSSIDSHKNKTFSFELKKDFEIFSIKNTIKPNFKYFFVESTKLNNRTLWQTDLSYILEYTMWKFDFSISSDLIYREGYDFYLAPGGSVSFAVFEGIKFYGSVSRGLLFPSFNDLYWPEDSFSKGNSNLLPEDGIRWQTGIVCLIFPFYLNLSYVESYIENQILWKPSGGIWMPDNIGRVFSRIFNVIARYEDVIFDFKTKAEISFSYNYSINNSIDSIYYLKRIMYVPLYKWSVSFSIEYKNIFRCISAYRYISERFINEENSVWLEPYGIMDFEIGLYAFYFIVENLFDVNYQEINGYPQPGRCFKAGLKFEF